MMKPFFKKLYSYWMFFAKILGIINTVLLLSITYVVIFPFIVLLHKIFGSSYISFWHPLRFQKISEENYFHPF